MFLALAFATASEARAMDLPAAGRASATLAPAILQADFRAASLSVRARKMADWVAASGDNRGLPFIVVDKGNARLFLFDMHARAPRLRALLLGLARGEVSPLGVGTRPSSRNHAGRMDQAGGRFVASAGHNLAGSDIEWIDYADAVWLHRAADSKPGLTAKSRLDRIETVSTLDNHIAQGCINVTAEFFGGVVRPGFRDGYMIVYVLPKTRSLRAVFNTASSPPRGRFKAPGRRE